MRVSNSTSGAAIMAAELAYPPQPTTLNPARWMMVAHSGSCETGIINISLACKYCLKRYVFFILSFTLEVLVSAGQNNAENRTGKGLHTTAKANEAAMLFYNTLGYP